MGIAGKMKKILAVNIGQYVYYNYFSKRVLADPGCRIIPYRGTKISMAKNARIELHGDLVLNDNIIRGSKAECLVLLREHARFTVNGPVQLYYGTTLQVHKNAELTMGEAHMNTGTCIICAYKITLGQLVSTARNVFIFDSDHHPIYNAEGKRVNEAKEVVIGDHVWLGLKSTVMKGTHIESGTVVGAHSLVSGNIPGHALVATAPARPVMKDISWER
ncbi:MAG: acyltransferase [Lachnospiraceae bacterium]|nr:acyltransferase [Lachnospiraceae bacterium]